MPEDDYYERPLFGGAISSCFPLRFQDVSEIREVPDHQEAFVDSNRDESLIFELLDFKREIQDSKSAVWFLHDLALEQDAEGSMVHEYSGIVEAVGLRYRDAPVIYTTAIGEMAISRGKQERETQNIVRVYVANLRLKEVGTDVLITACEPISKNPLGGSSRMVGDDGSTASFAASGYLPVSEVFKLAVTSFKVHDWNLFGAGT
ncbi:hypothetical protein AXF42_Ash010756 [Apostasia shenzhenica]|uniref:Ran guanine nucleotide release factor n=1 Tax=Apostasia shenzhenica TaxID=1088818 RepID=A0A2I0A0K7_9ASPA|nr:hypothetical protein AXF42_Ash010756 [Apostasia shenzhenica]